jgi:hypothetical protein
MREIFRQYFTKGFGFGAGFIAVLFTAGLLAVAVSTMTTFTTGTPAKASEVNANFAALKTAIEGIPTGWIASPAVTDFATNAVFDCGGFTTSTGSNGGTIGQASSVSSQMCSGSFAVLCCL